MELAEENDRTVAMGIGGARFFSKEDLLLRCGLILQGRYHVCMRYSGPDTAYLS